MAHETPSSQAYSNTELFSPENLTKLKSISYENNVALAPIYIEKAILPINFTILSKVKFASQNLPMMVSSLSFICSKTTIYSDN